MSRTSKAHWIAAAALMALPVLASAQGYYDDDIYYNPSKDKKAKPAATAPATYTPAAQSYAPADTYVFNTGSTFNVDDYNRRGQFLVSDTVQPAADNDVDYFANTRRIERFHNSDVVVNSGDDALISYYYTQPSTINIYIDNDPWYFPRWSWSWAYTNPLYNWSWGYYDPWWNPVWGWSWSSYWGPGWGPSWSWGWRPSWSWGPSWAWGWGHGWHHGWGSGWHPGTGHGPGWNPGHGNHWAYRPTGPGSSRPHANTNGTSRNPGSAQGTIRPGQTSRPGQTTRPGGAVANTGRPATANGSSANTSRPGSATQHVTTAPATATPSYGSNSGTRGRNNYNSGTNSGSNRNSNSYNSNRQNSNNNNNSYNNRNNNNSNRNSYNSNSGSSNTGRSSYSSGGGGSRGGNTGGGSRSTGGGGGGRGRR